MIVFISDVHLDDQTAGVQSLPFRAFSGAFDDIARIANDAGSTKIELVFLGDVFDLVRTTAWTEFDERERPWGVVDGLDAAERDRRLASVEMRANELLDRLVGAGDNRQIFEFLGGVLPGLPVQPDRYYIPGNHDRICNQFPTLRQRAIDLLGLRGWDSGRPFPSYYKNDRYGVFARHGHEWDTWNIEAPSTIPIGPVDAFTYDTYMKIPIGELIAAEIASQLAPRVSGAIEQAFPEMPGSDRQAIADQFRVVDDVRPIAAIFPWLLDKLNDLRDRQQVADDVMAAVKNGINQVIENFQSLEYTQQWMKRHASWNPLAHGNLLHDILWLGDHLNLNAIRDLVPLANFASGGTQDDNFASKALDDFRRLDFDPHDHGKFLYVLYGHTHKPEQTPISVTSSPRRPRTYINTGTWRPSHVQSLDKTGFVTTKGITYSIVYHPDDDPNSPAARGPERYATFETWTGALLEHPCVAGEA